MTTIHISEALYQRLRAFAERKQRDVTELSETAIEQFMNEQESDQLRGVDGLALLESAHRANIASPQIVDTSEHTNEILQNEYADYLRKRMGDQA